MLSGNHDHGLAAGWIDARLQSEPAGFLGLEQRFDAADAGPLARRLADLAPLQFAYPGIWLRDDVYATHGHYMDVHLRLPRAECLAAAIMVRLSRPPPNRCSSRAKQSNTTTDSDAPTSPRSRNSRTAANAAPDSGAT